MQALALLLLAIPALQAQSSMDSLVPPCLKACAAKASTSCSATDPSCACKDKTYITNIGGCAKTQCADELTDTVKAAVTICNGLGVVVQIPQDIQDAIDKESKGNSSDAAQGMSKTTTMTSESPAATTTPEKKAAASTVTPSMLLAGIVASLALGAFVF